MGWDRRPNGRKYFYRSVRQGKKVRRIYLGTGDEGRCHELMFDMHKEAKQKAKSWIQDLQERLARNDVIDAAITVGVAALGFVEYRLFIESRKARLILKKRQEFEMALTEKELQDTIISPELKERWHDLRIRASRGDPTAVEQFKALREEHPEIDDQIVDLLSLSTRVWLDLLIPLDGGLKESAQITISTLVKSMVTDRSDMLERLLIERVCVYWLQQKYYDVMQASLVKRSPEEQNFLASRQIAAENEFRHAIKAVEDFHDS
ncbi:MAG: hypothetical protein FJ267_19130, partial [Planctomycetes bacterium]|nr:hypothetical protein [Planctomycetota bacterium]